MHPPLSRVPCPIYHAFSKYWFHMRLPYDGAHKSASDEKPGVTMMKRVLILLVFLMMVGAMLSFPAAAAMGSGTAAQGEGCGPLFSFAPAPQVYGQASPGDPVISGIARDEQGNAVASVAVVAENPSSHAAVASATTDASGAYSLAVPSGTYDLKATPPTASGLNSGTYPSLAATGDVNLDILFVPSDLVTFKGRVLDRDGTPIPNQTVYLKRTPFGKTGSTDESGNFSIQVPPGDYSLEVINGLFVVPPDVPGTYSLSRSGTITLSQNTTMDITLNEVYVTGKVVDTLGLIPVGGSLVHLSGTTSFGAFSGSFDTYVTCDDSGNYSAVTFPCSTLTIEATPPDVSIYTYAKTTASMLVDGSKNVNVPLGAVFSGFLFDRDGTPIPDQSVVLKKTGFTKSGVTGALGYFAVKVPTGTYTVEVSNGFLSNAPNVPSSYTLTRSSTVNITALGLIQNLTINEVYVTGKVLSPTGTAVPDTLVHFSASDTFGSYTGKYDSIATSDSSGNYSVVVLASSNTTIEATPQESTAFAYTRLVGQSITADVTTNITLANAFTFSGTLTDRDGTPIQNQSVLLKKSDLSKMCGTDSNGAFTTKVPAGVYSLELMTGFFVNPSDVPSSYQLAETGAITIAGNTTKNITLNEVYVNGKVVDPSGALASGVELAMSGSDTWGTMTGKFDSRVTTDGWGSFNATLFPTAVTLEATPQVANGYGPSQTVNLDVSNDKSLFIILCESYDGMAPKSVDNLAVAAAYDESASLSWTAPGDNGSYGQAAAYDIRYSTSPITDANWAAAAQCTGEPAPKAAGQPETFLVSGLAPSTTYYFAMKTADEAPNWSGLSNVASGTTLAFINLTVTGITPSNVPQFSWWVNLEITGTGFQPGATAKLMMGETPIEASNVTVVSENKLTCTVLIIAQSPGFYDVVVTNPGGKQARLYFAFSIGANCGTGSGTAVLAFGLCLGLLSLASSTGLRRRRKRRA